MTNLTIALTQDEMEKLRRAAKSDLRQPRDQARHLLRLALFGNANPSTKANTYTAPTAGKTQEVKA